MKEQWDYTCAVCRTHDRLAHATCPHPMCPDGHDQPGPKPWQSSAEQAANAELDRVRESRRDLERRVDEAETRLDWHWWIIVLLIAYIIAEGTYEMIFR